MNNVLILMYFNYPQSVLICVAVSVKKNSIGLLYHLVGPHESYIYFNIWKFYLDVCML